MDTGCVKEQTIRELVAQCQKLQAEIQVRLDSNFARKTGGDANCKDNPTLPNVLDEIIRGLNELGIEQKRTLEFITINIEPKL